MEKLTHVMTGKIGGGLTEERNMKIYTQMVLWLVLASIAQGSRGFTFPADVFAINSLCAALGYPAIPGWIAIGGDPCDGTWQGIRCDSELIVSITIVGANLGGQLGDNLGSFTALQELILSNNHIGGSIPSNLPVTLQGLFLSGNKLIGSIPTSLSTLKQLSALSLDGNLLSGEILDAFQGLAQLTNVNLARNNFGGSLPSSMESLSSLKSLDLNNNKFSGGLDVLQDLSLLELNIENNLFSGPIPDKLLSIPTFSYAGNLFLTLPSPTSPTTPPPAPTSLIVPPPAPTSLIVPPPTPRLNRKKHKSAITISPSVMALLITIIVLLSVVVLVVSLWVFVFHCLGRGKHDDITSQEVTPHLDGVNSLRQGGPLAQERTQSPDAPSERPLLPPRPICSDVCVKFFSMASFQDYTCNFSEENLCGSCRAGNLYRAELPDGKLLAIKKLNQNALCLHDHEFVEIVRSMAKVRHPSIAEPRGLCLEDDHRLIAYEYWSKGTLHDALHLNEGIKKYLTWHTRLQIALGAAKALEYLHEAHIIHGNFNCSNVLLDERLAAHVTDCGLLSLPTSCSICQSSGRLEGATSESDVYSFGVVMLELLTGRQSHNRGRNEEQLLVGWAIPQLHSIDALLKMLDPSLDGECHAKSLSHFADIVSRCVLTAPLLRPPMSHVVEDLQEMIRRTSHVSCLMELL